MSEADRIGVAHAVLRGCKLNANGAEFTVDEHGRLHPDPPAETARMLIQLANYSQVELEPAPEPAPEPKPKPKRRTRKRRAAQEE